MVGVMIAGATLRRRELWFSGSGCRTAAPGPRIDRVNGGGEVRLLGFLVAGHGSHGVGLARWPTEGTAASASPQQAEARVLVLEHAPQTTRRIG